MAILNNKQGIFFMNNDEQKISKNLKLMSLSAIILLSLFIYAGFGNDYSLNSSYYLGVFFLIILIIFAFLAQKYKYVLRDFIGKYITSKVKTSNNENFNINNKTQESNLFSKDLNSMDALDIKPVVCNVALSDIAGLKESKQELKEIIDFLHNPQKYKKYGVVLPKGVLLVGPPGVGKTMLAKALSCEANVPFYYASGASFVHIYVGMGAKRVRELFAKARANSPCIVFIDEIDSIGKKRGNGSNDERDSTLNELLTQMDGFDDSSFVLVVGATNKVDVLDDALLRAKRFDRKINLALPSVKDRFELISSCLVGKKHNINIQNLANDTSALNFASISTLINEAILNMLKETSQDGGRKDKKIKQSDIEIAKTKVKFGISETKLLDTEQKDVLATYQASMAFFTKQKTFLNSTQIMQNNIIYPSFKDLKEQIRNYLAGDEGLKALKGDGYFIDKTNITNAYKLANEICSEYKMYSNKNKLIAKIKKSLQKEIINNKDIILDLKKKLLNDEVVFYKS
jgi:ATP-dependent Zn protease